IVVALFRFGDLIGGKRFLGGFSEPPLRGPLELSVQERLEPRSWRSALRKSGEGEIFSNPFLGRQDLSTQIIEVSAARTASELQQSPGLVGAGFHLLGDACVAAEIGEGFYPHELRKIRSVVPVFELFSEVDLRESGLRNKGWIVLAQGVRE